MELWLSFYGHPNPTHRNALFVRSSDEEEDREEDKEEDKDEDKGEGEDKDEDKDNEEDEEEEECQPHLKRTHTNLICERVR